MSSALDSIGPDDKRKLETFIAAYLRVSQEIADLRDGLKDTAKSLAAELGLEKPALLMKAGRTAFKSSLEADKVIQDTVEDILTITGHA
ncbi:unnamed protein product [Sphagnum tenellum]